MEEKFNMFMETVDEHFRSFVNQINEYLTASGYKCDIKLQKDFGGIYIPKNGNEASHLSRTYRGVSELS